MLHVVFGMLIRDVHGIVFVVPRFGNFLTWLIMMTPHRGEPIEKGVGQHCLLQSTLSYTLRMMAEYMHTLGYMLH
jgi:hypothetical protein